MPGFKLDLTGDWSKLSKTLNPKHFNEILEDNLLAATKFNGMIMAAEIRKRIRQRRYAKNSALTVLLKKSSMPLVDDADLFGAITSRELDRFSVFVGILRTATTSSGQPMVNLAELLHNGGSIPVTEHMRNMFILLSEVGQGKRDINTLEGRTLELARALGSKISQIKPLKPSTVFIKIPARPFLAEVLKDQAMLKKCVRNWENAVNQALIGKKANIMSPDKSSPGKTGGTKTPGSGSPPKHQNRSTAAKKGWQTRRNKQASKKPS